ncbi:MAG: hypothetical protein IT328_20125 [Caldilineaceae bacterium]|nr:hypothetical protein [Caldilineaceae bacterium]
MANPRDDVRFEGIGYKAQTFKIDNSTITYDATKANGSAQVGLAVTFSAAKTVQLVGDGEAVVGKLIQVEADGKAVVQTGGYASFPGGTSAGLTLGKKIVGDLLVAAEGYIREVATATAAELGVARGQIVDASDTAEVWVNLDA